MIVNACVPLNRKHICMLKAKSISDKMIIWPILTKEHRHIKNQNGYAIKLLLLFSKNILVFFLIIGEIM